MENLDNIYKGISEQLKRKYGRKISPDDVKWLVSRYAEYVVHNTQQLEGTRLPYIGGIQLKYAEQLKHNFRILMTKKGYSSEIIESMIENKQYLNYKNEIDLKYGRTP